MELKITNLMNDKKDFLFVSYKREDQGTVERILSTLQEKTGLHIYYDKDFETRNESWLRLVEDHLTSKYCKGMLVFGSPHYKCSYACLIELLFFRTLDTRDTVSGKPKPIIPIVLQGKVGLEKMDYDIQLAQKLQQDEKSQELAYSEGQFLKYKVIDSLRDYSEHLLKDPDWGRKDIEQLMDLLKKMERLFHIRDEEYRGEILCVDVSECMSSFFKLQKENDNWYEENDEFYINLCDMIRRICGEGVFEPHDTPVPEGQVTLIEDSASATKNTNLASVAQTDPATDESPAPKKRHVPQNYTSIARHAEVSLSQFAGTVRPSTTAGEFRVLLNDPDFCQALRQLRGDKALFPQQKGLFDYAMAAVLSGCNVIQYSYQENYCELVVADPDKKVAGAKSSARFTWSSNARKAAGFEGSGKLDPAHNAPFEALPESTTLAQLRDAFLRADSVEYQTKDSAAVARVFDVLFEQLG